MVRASTRPLTAARIRGQTSERTRRSWATWSKTSTSIRSRGRRFCWLRTRRPTRRPSRHTSAGNRRVSAALLLPRAGRRWVVRVRPVPRPQLAVRLAGRIWRVREGEPVAGLLFQPVLRALTRVDVQRGWQVTHQVGFGLLADGRQHHLPQRADLRRQVGVVRAAEDVILWLTAIRVFPRVVG